VSRIVAAGSQVSHGKFGELRRLLERALDQTRREQQSRLRTLRDSGPWHPDWADAVRLQRECAKEMLYRIGRYRELEQSIQAHEAHLPPSTGWTRLRYMNPWIITCFLAGLTVVRLSM